MAARTRSRSRTSRCEASRTTARRHGRLPPPRRRASAASSASRACDERVDLDDALRRRGASHCKRDRRRSAGRRCRRSRPERDRLRRGRRRRPPRSCASSFLKPVPRRRLYGDHGRTRRSRDHDRRRHAHRRHQAGRRRARRRPQRLRVEVDRSPATSRPTSLAHPERAGRSTAVRRSVRFSFMAACPIDVDCRHVVACPPPELDRAAARLPRQGLRELPAAALDLLPHAQPGLDRAQPVRPRHGAARAARLRGRPALVLPGRGRQRGVPRTRCGTASRRGGTPGSIDYRMHDGRNAWAPVHSGSLAAPVHARARHDARSRSCSAPLPGQTALPGPTVPTRRRSPSRRSRAIPTLASVVVFETAHDVDAAPRQQRDPHPHLGRRGVLPAAPASPRRTSTRCPNGLTTARVPLLEAGDYLVFEEVVGPRTRRGSRRRSGAPPGRRASRRSPSTRRPALRAHARSADVLQSAGTGQPALPLLRVRWRRADALRFPLCLSARLDDDTLVRNVSVARGNIVLADHGLTIERDVRAGRRSRSTAASSSSRGPLTMEARPEQRLLRRRHGAARSTDRTELAADVARRSPRSRCS